jgi:hypothetical protein
MAKVVTERPRHGHGAPSKKWGRRLRKNEYDADDHGPTRAPIARRRQYSGRSKHFSDLIGPLRRYLFKQVGRPWNDVWSDITGTLDNRSLSGQHIFDHIRWEVAERTTLAADGCVYAVRWSIAKRVEGLYVHPVTGLLCHAPTARPRDGHAAFMRAQAALRAFGIEVTTHADSQRYRVDGLRVWERRDCGWFIHTYRVTPGPLVRVVTRCDGSEVPIYGAPRYERVATKQASRKEMRLALCSDRDRSSHATRNDWTRADGRKHGTAPHARQP